MDQPKTLDLTNKTKWKKKHLMKAKLTKKIFFNLIKTKLVLKIVAIQIQNAFFQTAKEKKKNLFSICFKIVTCKILFLKQTC